jgi:sterol desaturase/sphingolipid hydroxylase (fatty acid hydroxylase superfamily)
MELVFSELYTRFFDHGSRILFAAGVLTLLEFMLSGEKHSFQSRFRGAFFAAAYIGITTLFFTLFSKFLNFIGIKPLIQIDLSSWSHWNNPVFDVVGALVAVIIVGIAGDFFYYWFHRLQHTNAFLWRFHAVHHSLREMNAFNSNHHFTEEIFRIPFVMLPFGLLVSMSAGDTPVIIATIFGMHGIFIHSSTRFNLGFGNRIIADNRFHRIHHSIDRRHWGKNYGSSSSIWDVLFKTAYFPKADEPMPATGLKAVPEPQNLHAFLFSPFQGLRKSRKPVQETAVHT